MLKSKQEMRKNVKKEAAQLTEAYCKDADEMIFRNIRALPEYQRADTVFCYVGTKTGNQYDADFKRHFRKWKDFRCS